jgi:type II secretory pathway pseudopilin PulG
MIRSSQSGISLIDILVGIAIASVMASIAVPSVGSLFGQMQASNDLRKLTSILSELRSEAIRTKTNVRISFFERGYSWDIGDDGVVDGRTDLLKASTWRDGNPPSIVFNGLGIARGIGEAITISVKNRNRSLECEINSNGYISL